MAVNASVVDKPVNCNSTQITHTSLNSTGW